MSDQHDQAPPVPTLEPTLGPAATEHSEKIEEMKSAADTVFKGKVIRTRWAACKLEKLKCWPDVLAMIESAESVPRIATYIQAQRQEYLDATRDAVESALYHWIRKNRRMIGERTPVVHVQLINSNPGRIDPLDALNMLFAIQVDRITEHYVAEKRAGAFTKFNNEAIKIAAKMAETMAEIDGKRRRYAPPPPSAAKGPNEVMNQIEAMKRVYEQRYGGTAARAIMNDDSRRRILNALERVRKGSSDKLMEILNINEQRAEDLAKQAERRAAEEAATIDVEASDA